MPFGEWQYRIPRTIVSDKAKGFGNICRALLGALTLV